MERLIMLRDGRTIDSPGIAAAKARAEDTDYIRKWGPDPTFWTHCLWHSECTSADYDKAARLIERTNPEATRFIAHLRDMESIALAREEDQRNWPWR